MDFSALAIFCFEKDSIAIRITLNSTISEINKILCQKWNNLSPLLIELSVVRDGSHTLIHSDANLQLLAAYVFAKQFPYVEVSVSVVHSASNAIVSVVHSACNAIVLSEVCNSCSFGVQNFDDPDEVRQPLKYSYWGTLISSVGQVFSGGADDFRGALLKYSIETGFKVNMKKNDKSRVTAVCGMKDVTGCEWRVHASSLKLLPSLFKIKKLNPVHTCGSGFRDTRNPPMSKKFVKSLILNQMRDKPLIRPKEIVNIFKTDYGVTLNYYYARAGKELALEHIYGDDILSYSNLRWFVDTLIKTNPGSHVVLKVSQESRKFERIFISFDACIKGFNYCRPLMFLDGTFLKGKFKGCLMAGIGKTGNEGIFPLAYAIVVAEDDAN